MEEKKDRDIVDIIVTRLKAGADLPYREGAWERFRESKLKRNRKFSPIWAVATLALLGAFGGFWLLKSPTRFETKSVVVTDPISHDESSRSFEDDARRVEHGDLVSQSQHGQDVLRVVEDSAMPFSEGLSGDKQSNRREVASIRILETSPTDRPMQVRLPDFVLPSRPMMSGYRDVEERSPIILDKHILAQDDYAIMTKGKEVLGENKQFRLGDKLSLGLVVSPSTTDQRMNFGGGLLVSYNVSKNLSIRTGATFNQYEVGELKDPTQPAATMEVAKSADRPAQADVSYLPNNSFMMARTPLIPNVNAISGSVQTIDVPLEAKYTAYRGLYISAGVSYAAVLNQARYAHYVENVHTDPYIKGLPADESEMRAAVQQVTRTIESTTENVNTNGFGGFVNMSVGKEMKMGKGVSLSLEPYIKLPVGNFRRADMNYRNGGIRVITNF